MSEEQKEEKKETPVAEAPAAATEAPAAATTAPVAAKEKAPAPAKIASGKGSRPKQCTQCSKNLKKKTWYYRDNKYFCNKPCWKASKVPKEVAA